MRVPRDNSPRLRTFGRQMRKSATDAEAKLWSILRSRGLNGFKFRRQHAMAGYILDFYCVSEHLTVELDGGQHADTVNAAYDLKRTRRLTDLGVRIIRFWDHDVLKETDAVAEEILRHLNAPSPPPSPGVPGEGE